MLANHITRRLPGGRPFHLLVLALAASSLGDWLYNVALLALVYARTGLADLGGCHHRRTRTADGPPRSGGALAGRHNRRTLMIVSDTARAVLMAALAVVAGTGLPIVLVPLLCALATGAGVAVPPAVAASSARLVDDGERQQANALRAAIGQGAVVTGPPLGALALWLAGPTHRAQRPQLPVLRGRRRRDWRQRRVRSRRRAVAGGSPSRRPWRASSSAP